MEHAIAYLDRHINLEATAGRVDGLSLDNMRRLMTALGDPQLDFPVIQVTGTNGKGSTAAMITALLSSMGLTVGTYGSPHVSSITERIQRNGENIEPSEFAAVVGLLEAAEPTLSHTPSWFELMTAAAYHWFADIAVDVAVVEVGKLGRFDATSVVDPVVAVITNVRFDHTDGSDGWRRNIAWEKAGIIKPGSILCLGEPDPELEDLFVAEQPGEVLRCGADFDCEDNLLAVGGRQITLRTSRSRAPDVFLSLHGAHQGDNAAIALAAAEAFLGSPIPEDAITEALAQIRLPGRFEVLATEPLLIVDGAHNPDGAAAAVRTLDDGFNVAGRRHLIVGMMAERDPEWMLRALSAHDADVVVACTPPSPRGMPAEQLGAVAREMGLVTEVAADPADALGRARALATEDDLIFAAG
ncbi:MAG: folylpolyglutamate synthase/dihydrofolate synthase family protein, partial [Acidimicrobiales bacterium]